MRSRASLPCFAGSWNSSGASWWRLIGPRSRSPEHQGHDYNAARGAALLAEAEKKVSAYLRELDESDAAEGSNQAGVEARLSVAELKEKIAGLRGDAKASCEGVARDLAQSESARSR